MVFYAYVDESNRDPALRRYQVELKFIDPDTADQWWCAVSDIPQLAEAIRRIHPQLYTNDTTKFDITTFFDSFDAKIRALSQRFLQKLTITLVKVNRHEEPGRDPRAKPRPWEISSQHAGVTPPQIAPAIDRSKDNENRNNNWLSIRSTSDSKVFWDPDTDPRHVKVSKSSRTMFQVAKEPLPQASNHNPEKAIQKAPLRFTNEDRFSLNMELPDSISDVHSFFDYINVNYKGDGIPVNGLNGLVVDVGVVINALNGPPNGFGFKNTQMGCNSDNNEKVSHRPTPKEGSNLAFAGLNQDQGNAKRCCFSSRPLKKKNPAVFKPQPEAGPAVAQPLGGPHPVAGGSSPGGNPASGWRHGGAPQSGWRGCGHGGWSQ